MKQRIQIFFLTIALTLLPAVTALAQCPMCRMSAEQSDWRTGLNSAILYLLAAPVLLMGGVFAYWYFNRKRFGG